VWSSSAARTSAGTGQADGAWPHREARVRAGPVSEQRRTTQWASRRRGRGGTDEAQSERTTYTGSVRPDV
jgi:hypothetical protein